jgi:hypothetical protein
MADAKKKKKKEAVVIEPNMEILNEPVDVIQLSGKYLTTLFQTFCRNHSINTVADLKEKGDTLQRNRGFGQKMYSDLKKWFKEQGHSF